MKNLLMRSALIFALTGVSLGIASDRITDDETNKEHRITSAAEFSELEIQEFCREGIKGMYLSIEHTDLLFDLDIDTNIFEIQDPSPVKAKVLKSAFLKCEDGIHYFSSDYRTWKKLRDLFNVSISICPKTHLVKVTLHLNVPEKKE